MANPWIQFIISAAVIVWAGNRLTHSAKTIADNTGIGTAWAGALMLPLVTSLPELVTSLRSVMIDAPDLALGNIFGSNLYNLALLAVVDLAKGRGTLTARVNPGHVLTASLSMITLCLASLAILESPLFLPIGWVGIETIVIGIIYLFGSRLIFKYEKRTMPLFVESSAARSGSRFSATRPAVLQYLLAASLIVGAGIFLTDAADIIALNTGLGRTFVGSLFLAISTSLPETVTTLSAVRLGVLDMAVANVFGANFMNMFILFWADLFYRPAPILTAVSQTHLLSAVIVIMLTTVMIIGLVYRSQKELIRIGYDSLAVIIGYFMAIYLIFSTSVK